MDSPLLNLRRTLTSLCKEMVLLHNINCYTPLNSTETCMFAFEKFFTVQLSRFVKVNIGSAHPGINVQCTVEGWD